MVPLNVTVGAGKYDPKLLPVMVTEVPAGPEVGDRLVMIGAVPTVKLCPLLGTPPTVTTTLPVVAPLGTFTVMMPGLKWRPCPRWRAPLKVTVLVP